MKLVPLPCLLLALSVLSACQPEIGESCSSSLDCSSQGDRFCDETQPGGYCTLPGCDKGSCPDEAVCVAFRHGDPRLAVSYCMYQCDDGSDCRGGEHYACLGENDFGVPGEQEAKVLDGSRKKFCAQRALPLESRQDTEQDAGPTNSQDAGPTNSQDAGPINSQDAAP